MGLALRWPLPGQMTLEGIESLPEKPQPKQSASSKPKKSQKAKVIALKLSAAFLKFLEKQLSLPFLDGSPDEDREPILPVVPQSILDRGWDDVVTNHSSKKEGSESFRWSDAAIFSAHAELLHKTLEVFTFPSNIEAKLDAICWIFAGDWLEVDGEMRYAIEVPLSYNACCHICGYDRSVFQDFIYDQLPEEVQEILRLANAA